MEKMHNQQIDDDTTRTTARLPGLEIEIVHRRLPAADAELISINLQAVPSFDAFGRFLQTANPFAFWTHAQMAWFLAQSCEHPDVALERHLNTAEAFARTLARLTMKLRWHEPQSPFTFKLSSEGQDMTETLAAKKCTPCRGGIAPLSHEEAEEKNPAPFDVIWALSQITSATARQTE